MENGKKLSLDQMLHDILSSTKQKMRYKKVDQKVIEQQYHFRPVEDASSHNVKMKAVGFAKGGVQMVLDHTIALWLIHCLACV